MPFLTVAGLSPRCLQDQWSEDPPDLQGDFARVFSGEGQNSQRSPKRNFSGPVDFLTPAEMNAFWAAISVTGEIGVAKRVPVTSDPDGLTRGASLDCYCWLGKAQALVWHDETGTKTAFWSVTLTIKEA